MGEQGLYARFGIPLTAVIFWSLENLMGGVTREPIVVVLIKS